MVPLGLKEALVPRESKVQLAFKALLVFKEALALRGRKGLQA
jgi:hypothetical protein